MTNEMHEVFNYQLNKYKQLRNELIADTELSDTEKDWMLRQIQYSLNHQTQMIELELA